MSQVAFATVAALLSETSPAFTASWSSGSVSRSERSASARSMAPRETFQSEAASSDHLAPSIGVVSDVATPIALPRPAFFPPDFDASAWFFAARSW